MHKSLWAPLVLLLVLSACGSSGKKSAPPLTKAQFTQQADAICKRHNDELNAAGKQQTSTKDAIFKAILPSLRAEASEVRALRPPAADRATITKMLDNLESGLDEFEKNAKADPAAALQKEPQGIKDAIDAANAYGLKECGSP